MPKGLVVVMLLAACTVAACGGGNQPNGFCGNHDCIANFDLGTGAVVQCVDGMWSHSGGQQGGCSQHGGFVESEPTAIPGSGGFFDTPDDHKGGYLDTEDGGGFFNP